MDYEKLYKDALERARIFKEHLLEIDEKDYADEMEYIFPELQESEDERIKKALIRFHKSSIDIDGIKGEDILAWLEKQGNPADKIEPKFKVGDFIVNDYCMGKVIELTNDAYLLDTEQGIPFSCEHNAHLWTIADAKNGDVLLTKHNLPFIYNGIFDAKNVGAYCGIGSLGNDFLEANFPCNWSYKEGVKPATKEQRDLLFQKMHEAGYEWDADKKEVKKIENFPILSNSAKTGKNWSEEDEIGSDETIELLEYFINYAPEFRKSTIRRSIDWLISLKQRMGGEE